MSLLLFSKFGSIGVWVVPNGVVITWCLSPSSLDTDTTRFRCIGGTFPFPSLILLSLFSFSGLLYDWYVCIWMVAVSIGDSCDEITAFILFFLCLLIIKKSDIITHNKQTITPIPIKLTASYLLSLSLSFCAAFVFEANIPFVVSWTARPEIVGENDGENVVGPFVGILEGVLDGINDGYFVGDLDGCFEGAFDGNDGNSVGIFVGDGVGSFVGDGVGSFVGAGVGLFVGDGVGLLVGDDVNEDMYTSGKFKIFTVVPIYIESYQQCYKIESK